MKTEATYTSRSLLSQSGSFSPESRWPYARHYHPEDRTAEQSRALEQLHGSDFQLPPIEQISVSYRARRSKCRAWRGGGADKYPGKDPEVFRGEIANRLCVEFHRCGLSSELSSLRIKNKDAAQNVDGAKDRGREKSDKLIALSPTADSGEYLDVAHVSTQIHSVYSSDLVFRNGRRVLLAKRKVVYI